MAERQPPRKNADGTVTITLAEPVHYDGRAETEALNAPAFRPQWSTSS